mmetsp:Transcript_39917/g.114385  ORF Transcript_39917/g.114385 Transcript_39917/m.114385 type:complete len:253 (+) Transcript_39917:425-1183(+)
MRRSKRPGRNIAGSTMSGRLVAAMTYTCDRSATPSISVSIWFTTRSDDELPSEDLFGTSASSSSKKMTHGEDVRARWKTNRTARSDSPTYLFKSSGPLTAIKLAPLALATALASNVLPQPGGPNKSTPIGTVRPKRRKSAALRMGSQTAASRSARTSWREPMSSHVTFGTTVNPSRRDDGCTRVRATWKSSISTARPAISSNEYGLKSSSCFSISPPDSSCGNARLLFKSAKPRTMQLSAASLVNADRSAPT